MMPVIWITGLSGSGKSTLSNAIAKILIESGIKPIQLDGDAVRKTLSFDLGFTKKDRMTHILRIQNITKLLSLQNFVVIVSALYFDDNIAKWNKENFGNYKEIYIESSVKFLMDRNQKNIYSNFKCKKIENVVGLDIEYTPPAQPDLVFHAEKEIAPYEMARIVVKLLNFENERIINEI